MVTKTGVDILDTTLLIKQAKASKARAVVAKTGSNDPVSKGSQGFIRRKMIHGRPYYYLVKSVRIGGKVKQVVLRYLGTRKPKGYRV